MPIEKLIGIFKDLTTALALIIGGWWAYRKFINQREAYPKIIFELDINFIGIVNGCWIVELVCNLENKGLVKHEIETKSFTFNLRYLKENDILVNKFKIQETTVYQLFFPHKFEVDNLSEFQWLPDTWGGTFIEPGTKQKYSHLLSLPTDINILLLHARFNYTREGDFHTAEVTRTVPKYNGS